MVGSGARDHGRSLVVVLKELHTWDFVFMCGGLVWYIPETIMGVRAHLGMVPFAHVSKETRCWDNRFAGVVLGCILATISGHSLSVRIDI